MYVCFLRVEDGCSNDGDIHTVLANHGQTQLHQVRPGPVFIKHLKSNVYVTLNAIGSFQCNLCSHWLIQIFIT